MKIALLGLGLLHMHGSMAGMLMAAQPVPEEGNGGGGLNPPWVAGEQLVTTTQPAPGQIGLSPSSVPIVVADPATTRIPRTDQIENPVPEETTRVTEAPRLFAVEGRDLWETTPLSVILQEQKDLRKQQASPVTGVTVSPATSTGAAGSNVQLSAVAAPAAGVQSVAWTTSDATKATVDQTGKVTRVATGTATITATSTVDSSKKNTSAITIS